MRPDFSNFHPTARFGPTGVAADRILTVVLFILLMATSGKIHATAWDLDPSFGSGGLQIANFDAGGSNTDHIVKLLRYPDNLNGKYVAVGSASLANGNLGIA
jgi:hypothetical protein